MTERVREALSKVELGAGAHHTPSLAHLKGKRCYRFGAEFEKYYAHRPDSLKERLEAELRIRHPHPPLGDEMDETEFAGNMADHHNRSLKSSEGSREMFSKLGKRDARSLELSEDHHWTVETDQTCVSIMPPPFGLETQTPILDPWNWRSILDPTLQLNDGRYHVTGDGNCSTQTHVSFKPPYLLTDLKLIAQAYVYWKPAFLALLPDERNGNLHVRSIFADNKNFAPAGKTRDAAIETIEQCANIKEFLDVTQPLSSAKEDREAILRNYWAINYLNILNPRKTVELRFGTYCQSLKDAHMWISVFVCFILATRHAGSIKAVIEKHQRTVAGLEDFLLSAFFDEADANNMQYSAKDVFEKQYVKLLFAHGKQHHRTCRPKAWNEAQLSTQEKNRLAQLTKDDEGAGSWEKALAMKVVDVPQHENNLEHAR